MIGFLTTSNVTTGGCTCAQALKVHRLVQTKARISYIVRLYFRSLSAKIPEADDWRSTVVCIVVASAAQTVKVLLA